MTTPTMNDVEAACKLARDTRTVLGIRAQALQDEIADAQKRKLPGIKKAVEAVAEADAALLALLQKAPHLFTRPKSVVFHGLKVGYKAGSGTVEIPDAAAVVKAIRKHLPDQFETLVKVKETPIKAAIRNLTGADLQKIGVTMPARGEVVFLDDTTDQVDKLVQALLKGADVAQEEEAEAE